MAWCCQATSHYLNQCWPSCLSPYGITRPHYVNKFLKVKVYEICIILVPNYGKHIFINGLLMRHFIHLAIIENQEFLWYQLCRHWWQQRLLHSTTGDVKVGIVTTHSLMVQFSKLYMGPIWICWAFAGNHWVLIIMINLTSMIKEAYSNDKESIFGKLD